MKSQKSSALKSSLGFPRENFIPVNIFTLEIRPMQERNFVHDLRIVEIDGI